MVQNGRRNYLKTERYCYHYLHNSQKGKWRTERKDSGLIVVSVSETEQVELKVDVRDIRTLICFEGSIPFGQLPKASSILSFNLLEPLFCSMEHVYKRRHPAEEPPLYAYVTDIELRYHSRFFILLKTCRAVFRVYRHDTLQPRALIVDVNNGVASFSTSSY